jgi:hypothetical protein
VAQGANNVVEVIFAVGLVLGYALERRRKTVLIVGTDAAQEQLAENRDISCGHLK